MRRLALGLFRQRDIDEELRHRIASLARHRAANTLYLEATEPDLGTMRIAAWADATTRRHEDVLGSLGEPIESALAVRTDEYAAGRVPPVFVINRPQRDPVTDPSTPVRHRDSTRAA